MDPTPHWSAQDLRWVLDTALERGAHLLTAGEVHVVRQMQILPDVCLDLYARLSARTSPFQRVEVLPHSLVEAELVDELVPWGQRAERSTVAELKAGLTALGLPRAGKRADLIARIREHTHWSTQAWIRVRHRHLIRRLERWAFLKSHPDRSALVVERLGHITWPTYATTRGTALFPHRRALLAWEALLEQTMPEACCDALERSEARGPGRLDRTRSVAKQVLEQARDLERTEEPARARALYRRIQDLAPRYATRCAIRIARTLESETRLREAHAVLRDHRSSATGPERLSLNRAGRRVAKLARSGWAPDIPGSASMERTLGLHSTPPRGGRPCYRHGLFVEDAVIDLLATHGRSAVHAEGGLWITLFALLFADCYFLPIPGQLPVRHLSGPLDLGEPAFAEHRPEAVRRVLDGIQNGEAPDRIKTAWAQYEGTRLSGCRWQSDVQTQVFRAQALGPALLLRVLRVLLERGWSAARGLPDLLVLPGPMVQLPRAIPRRLGPQLILVEVKGPTDTLSDAQRWWIHHLAPVARVQVWRVKASSTGLPTRHRAEIPTPVESFSG